MGVTLSFMQGIARGESMPQGKRRPWTDEDTDKLIHLWGAVGSVALIAIMMQRSPSSVQTQASRKNLPPRAEEKDRHRRRWLPEDDAHLDELLVTTRREDGKIPILQVGAGMHRSVDAVVARLIARHGEDSDIMALLYAPEPPPPEPGSGPLQPLRPAARAAAAAADPKKAGRIQPCLKCRKSFWSEGRHNWVCINCKREKDWD
jgi:hypothetical protein